MVSYLKKLSSIIINSNFRSRTTIATFTVGLTISFIIIALPPIAVITPILNGIISTYATLGLAQRYLKIANNLKIALDNSSLFTDQKNTQEKSWVAKLTNKIPKLNPEIALVSISTFLILYFTPPVLLNFSAPFLTTLDNTSFLWSLSVTSTAVGFTTLNNIAKNFLKKYEDKSLKEKPIYYQMKKHLALITTTLYIFALGETSNRALSIPLGFYNTWDKIKDVFKALGYLGIHIVATIATLIHQARLIKSASDIRNKINGLRREGYSAAEDVAKLHDLEKEILSNPIPPIKPARKLLQILSFYLESFVTGGAQLIFVKPGAPAGINLNFLSSISLAMKNLHASKNFLFEVEYRNRFVFEEILSRNLGFKEAPIPPESKFQIISRYFKYIINILGRNGIEGKTMDGYLGKTAQEYNALRTKSLSSKQSTSTHRSILTIRELLARRDTQEADLAPPTITHNPTNLPHYVSNEIRMPNSQYTSPADSALSSSRDPSPIPNIPCDYSSYGVNSTIWRRDSSTSLSKILPTSSRNVTRRGSTSSSEICSSETALAVLKQRNRSISPLQQRRYL